VSGFETTRTVNVGDGSFAGAVQVAVCPAAGIGSWVVPSQL
jgi:hypothetical protein